jgi:hypothetical protein
LWDVRFQDWQARACRIANRHLTQSEWNRFIGPEIPYERTCPTCRRVRELRRFQAATEYKQLWGPLRTHLTRF